MDIISLLLATSQRPLFFSSITFKRLQESSSNTEDNGAHADTVGDSGTSVLSGGRGLGGSRLSGRSVSLGGGLAGGSSRGRNGSGEVGDGDTGLLAELLNGGDELCLYASASAKSGQRGEQNLLVISSSEHLPGTHLARLSWMGPAPVVHRHFWSVMEQPEAGTAAAKHERAHLGMLPKFWAEAVAATTAMTEKVEKRILMVGE